MPCSPLFRPLALGSLDFARGRGCTASTSGTLLHDMKQAEAIVRPPGASAMCFASPPCGRLATAFTVTQMLTACRLFLHD